jgi:hypothetical protein
MHCRSHYEVEVCSAKYVGHMHIEEFTLPDLGLLLSAIPGLTNVICSL